MSRVDAAPSYALIRLARPGLAARSRLAGLVSLVLMVTGAAVVLAAPSPASGAPSQVEEQAAVAADERSALAAAEAQGQRVEVLSARTSYSQTFATPRGTLLVEEHVRPQWIQSTDGAWSPADATLVRSPDGSWSPRGSTAQMRFSGGGDAPLASIGADGSSVSLRWPEPLPEPVVEGNVATYPDVAPGVDLQVVADVEGFTHLVVVRSPKALERVREITLGTQLSGVSLRVAGTGAVEAVNSAGEVVFTGPSPMMWDSRDMAGGAAEADPDGGDAERGGTAGEPGDAEPPRGATEPAMAPVSVAVEPGRLVITPNAGMLADPQTVYPVHVDPTWVKVTGKRNHWSLLRKTFPNSSFFDPAMGSIHPGGASDSTRGIVRAGFVVEDRTYTDRSVFNMATSAVRHRHVRKATFSLTQRWSWYNCGSTVRPVTELRAVTSFDSSTTWNSQPSWGSLLATSNKIRKYGHSCGPQRAEFNVTGRVRSAADAGWSSVNLGLRARSETHGNWSRFDRDAKLSIEYNSAPNAPSSLRVQGKPCGTQSAPAYVTVNRPTFSARISDRDSGQQSFATEFYWWRNGQSRNGNDVLDDATSSNPGTATSSSIPASKALVDRVVYRMQARTRDGIDDSSWSATCWFQAWLTTPNPPTDVVSTAYPEYDPNAPGSGSGGVGVQGQFTIAPPASGLADITHYAYTLDSGAPASAARTVAKRTDGSAVFNLIPSRDDVNILRVWSKDKAGLFSQPVEYRFRVRPGDGPAARWVFDDAALPGVDDTGHGNSLSVFNGAATTAGRAGVGSAVQLDGADDVLKADAALAQPHPDTGLPVPVRTNSTFTVAAWVRLETAGSTLVSTAVSVDGVNVSAFTLGYSGPDNRWRFAMPGSDVDNPSLARVLSSSAPVLARWTHLAGVYDASTGQLRLYVNGVRQTGTATLSGGFNASRTLVVGRRLWNGSFRDHFDGQVDDVRFYSFIPQETEILAAAKPLPPVVTFPDGDTAAAGGTLRVQFNAGGDANVTSVRYSVGSDALNQSVNLPTAGGTATVTIPVSTAGELSVVAAAVDRNSHLSDPVTAIATVTGGPEVSGVVLDESTGLPVAGATVVLDQAGLSVTTGPSGAFQFTGMAAGTYTLAAHIGGQCGMAAATEVEILAPVVVDLSLMAARDGFGYECHEAPGTPFTPIAGSVLGLTGDDAVTSVGLPFGFPFYGHPRTTAWVDTNGFLAFEDPAGSHPGGDGAIPSPAEPDALIAAYWADLVVDAQASVRTQLAGSAPSRTFTVEWRNVHLKGDTTARFSAQVTLHESGDISLNYTGLDNAVERGQEAVVGIESTGGQMGVQYSYKQSVLATNSKVTFPYPEEPNPITTVDLSGSVVDAATGQPAAGVQVLLDPAGLSVTSGTDGGFTFADLEWGSYTVEAKTRSHCGKASQIYVELEAPADVQLDLLPVADEYGYTCLAGPRGFLPTSTAVELSGDDLNQQVSLPFLFSLYGQSYSQMWVNTNGILVFAPESAGWHNPVEIPSVHLSPGAAVYGFWSDLMVDEATSRVRTGVAGTAPNRQFVVEWRNVHHVDDPSARLSFQVVLHETSNQVAVAWNEIGTNPLERGERAVVGIEDADGTIALPYQAFDQALASGQGVLFTPGGPGPHEVSGQVTCAGSPASGVEVRVADQSRVTDAQGGFSFTGVPPGTQGLVASATSGACAGAVSMPVTAIRGVPEIVEAPLTPVVQAPGYTVARTATTTLAADTVVTMPGTHSGDDEYVAVTPPFPVRLYGQSYGQAWVDTNGYLTFVDYGRSEAIPFTVPTQEPWAPRAAVFPFWNDWVVDSQASVRTGVHGSAPNRRWVVEWRNVHPYFLWHRVSFQVVFEETTGRITFSYRDIEATFVERGGAGLTGLQNATGSVAVEFSHLAPVLRSDRGLVFTPVS
jgi:hypothetical protein